VGPGAGLPGGVRERGSKHKRQQAEREGTAMQIEPRRGPWCKRRKKWTTLPDLACGSINGRRGLECRIKPSSSLYVDLMDHANTGERGKRWTRRT